jgi:hypothetical protein
MMFTAIDVNQHSLDFCIRVVAKVDLSSVSFDAKGEKENRLEHHKSLAIHEHLKQ